MKRAMEEVSEGVPSLTAAKRQATDAPNPAAASPPSHTPPLELCITVLPPLRNCDKGAQADEERRKRQHREEAMSRWPALKSPPQPHFTLPSESNDAV